MSKCAKLRPSFKFWIEFEGKRVLGKGGAAILEQIKKEGSISRAAEKLGMSYRYVWNYLDEVRRVVGEPIVCTFKGGKSGGGGAKLTELGEYLLSEYNRMSKSLDDFISSKKVGGEIREDECKEPFERKSCVRGEK
jgi:molybdate transport system regulatory protein